jgi:hypothetical protein
MEPNVGTDDTITTRRYFQYYRTLFGDCMSDVFSSKELTEMAWEEATRQLKLPTKCRHPQFPPLPIQGGEWEAEGEENGKA